MSQKIPVPDVAVLGELASQAAGTARSHLNAAKCLLDCGFWPQAYALSAIGLEEAGKAWLLVTAMLVPDELRAQLPFGDLGRDHIGKLSAGYSMLALLQLAKGGEGAPPDAATALASLDALARKAHEGRKHGLYTDLHEGVVESPVQVTEQQARDLVAAVQETLDGSGQIVTLVTSMWSRDAIPEPVRAFFARAAEAARGGEAAIEAFMRDEMAGIDPIAGVLKDDPEFLQSILDDPEWLASMLRVASENAPVDADARPTEHAGH